MNWPGMETERISTLTMRPTRRSAPKTFKSSKTKARRARVLLIAGLSAVVLWPLCAWVAAHLLIVKAELASADAIVVLSGSSTYKERTAWAAKLYREGRAPIVILTNDRLISGWDRVEERNPYFYELAAKELQRHGVPSEKIQVVSDIALGTYEETLGLRDYAGAHKLNRLLIVTSAYHSRRALWSMRHASERSGIEIGIDSPPPGWQTPAPSTWWLRRWGWRVVAGEYLKMAYYWMRY
jgi:uncharacterized SAM-binding protein YcdF (DUF218 family)